MPAHKLDENIRKAESLDLQTRSELYAKFYQTLKDEEFLDITDQILQSDLIKEEEKSNIREFDRRIILFNYLSDGLKIKGLISFVKNSDASPLAIILRGGNRIYGVQNPGSSLICLKKYTTIATMYRGGVSEGSDEFGGADVNDVKNLMDYIPNLENRFKKRFLDQKRFIIARSRGSMQMFLALARFPELQNGLTKIVSLSGLLDINLFMNLRSDIRELFEADFGMTKANEKEWLAYRNPVLHVDKLRNDLPILIVQGTKDHNVSLDEGYHMVERLRACGKNVEYVEIEGANHCLENFEGRTDLMLNWLES